MFVFVCSFKLLTEVALFLVYTKTKTLVKIKTLYSMNKEVCFVENPIVDYNH